MLPSFSLGYERSRQAGSLSSIRGQDIFWDLILNIVQPLFEGKRVMNEAKAAELQADASIENLMASVLKAIKEIEDKTGIEIDFQCREKMLTSALEE